MLAKPLTKPLYNPLTRLSEGFTTLASLVKQLFANNEEGWWYDPSDLSTLYQDAAGTQPVTAMEQFVGLILDKRKGLVLGPELAVAPWENNYITKFDTFASTSGSGFTGSVSAAKSNIRVRCLFPVAQGKYYKISFDLAASSLSLLGVFNEGGIYSGTNSHNITTITNGSKTSITLTGNSAAGLVFGFDFSAAGSVTVSNLKYQELPGNHAYQPTPTKRMKVSRRFNLLVGTASLATQNVSTVAGAHVLKFSGAGSVTLSGAATGAYSAGTHSITCTAGTLTLTVTGAVTDASLVLTIESFLPYQSVNTDTDYDDDPSKFPTYLKPDVIDDCYVTNAIDLTGTDKISVWAGITKLSDAVAGYFAELGDYINVPNGSFAIVAPASEAPNFLFATKGTIYGGETISGLPAPITLNLAMQSDIAGALATVMNNGVEIGRSTLTQGTGNYGNYPLFIGARGQTSLFFNGKIYSFLGRGALSNASQHAAVNQYIKQRMMLP